MESEGEQKGKHWITMYAVIVRLIFVGEVFKSLDKAPRAG